MNKNQYNVINSYTIVDLEVYLYIKNTKSEEATCIIDLSDLEKVQKYHWTIRKMGTHFYVKSTSSEITNLPLHHYIFKKPSLNTVIDHMDRNPLNNKKENLREVSFSINSSNAHYRTNSKSQIRGVYKRKARPGIAKESWICEWSIEGKRYSKSFSISKYGEDQAFELALNLRKEKEKELKI